jgi:hypothetical protein
MRSSRVLWMRSGRVFLDEFYPSCGWDLCGVVDEIKPSVVNEI